MPERIQLSRKKGFKLPANTVVVARPSKWGNPYRKTGDETNHYVVSCFRDYVRDHPDYRAQANEELAGKNLACWCKIGEECHADVLIEIANQK